MRIRYLNLKNGGFSHSERNRKGEISTAPKSSLLFVLSNLDRRYAECRSSSKLFDDCVSAQL